MRYLLLTLLLIILPLLLQAQSNKGLTDIEPKDLPEWVTKIPSNNDTLYSIGVGISSNIVIATNYALMDAQSNLSKIFADTLICFVKNNNGYYLKSDKDNEVDTVFIKLLQDTLHHKITKYLKTRTDVDIRGSEISKKATLSLNGKYYIINLLKCPKQNIKNYIIKK